MGIGQGLDFSFNSPLYLFVALGQAAFFYI